MDYEHTAHNRGVAGSTPALATTQVNTGKLADPEASGKRPGSWIQTKLAQKMHIHLTGDDWS